MKILIVAVLFCGSVFAQVQECPPVPGNPGMSTCALYSAGPMGVTGATVDDDRRDEQIRIMRTDLDQEQSNRRWGDGLLYLLCLVLLYLTIFHKKREPARQSQLIEAAKSADWGQVVSNGGPPCFHLQSESGRFCLRAERWDGHAEGEWPCHKYVSLADLIEAKK